MLHFDIVEERMEAMRGVCEDAAFTNFAIKAIHGMRNNNWICESAPFTNWSGLSGAFMT